MTKQTDFEVLRRLSQDTARVLPHDVLARVAAQMESDVKDDENRAKLQATGKSAAESIRDMVAALECDYDRLEELRQERKDIEEDGNPETETEYSDLQVWDNEHKDELDELVAAAGDCTSREDAEQRIHEDPLSVLVRSDWYDPSSSDADKAPSDFEILLSTGGPATRIIGELDEHGQPTSARLQAQDWGTPWTDYNGCDALPFSKVCELCLTYAQQFYFGEG